MQNREDPINTLPTEILRLCFSSLGDYSELANLFGTCRLWKREGDIAFKEAMKRIFPKVYANRLDPEYLAVVGTVDWRDEFYNTYQLYCRDFTP